MEILKNSYAATGQKVPFEKFWEEGIVRIDIPRR